jgi:hypothetical protein
MPVGTKATIRANEMMHDQGFAWKEPTHVFTCVSVIPNYGDFKTGYRQYLVEAPTAACVEIFTLERADWWPDEPKSFEVTINVLVGTVDLYDLDSYIGKLPHEWRATFTEVGDDKVFTVKESRE